MEESFRILSLDGGGIRGAYTAGALAALEKATGKRIIDHFDLITGTSIGGIIAIALGLGKKAIDIVTFFEESGPVIFPWTGFFGRLRKTIKQAFEPKYSREVITSELKKMFGKQKFGESACRLIINTYDAVSGAIFLLKTAHDKRFTFDIDADAVDVALATSAAPTYFAAAQFPQHPHSYYIDGGVWANSPVMVGLTEAVAFLKIPLDRIHLLSVGTTSEPFDVVKKKNAGIISWNVGLISLMMNAQAEASRAQAKLLLGDRYHRIDSNVIPGQYTLDSASNQKIGDLIALGNKEALKREHLEIVQSKFLNGEHAAPFIPAERV